MAENKKLTELSELGTVVNSDMLYVVDESSDVSYRVTKFNVKKLLEFTSTEDETISLLDSIQIVDTTAGAVAILIDSTSKVTKGARAIIKDNGNAGTNNITIAPQGGGTIDGAGSYVISADYGYVELYSDGTELFVIGEG